MAVSQSDLTNYLKKQGKKTTDKTDYTVLPTPVKPIVLPTYKATQPTVKNNLIGRNRATALDFNRTTTPKVTKPVASPIKALNVPKQTTDAMKSYSNDPVAKVLMAKDPISLATWKSANGTAFNSLDSNLKSYINDTIASHQSKIAAKSPSAARLMAGGSSAINSATFGLSDNKFIPQKVEHEGRYTTQPLADQLAANVQKAHPVASTVGNLAGTLVGGGITDVAAHAGLAGLKLGAKAVTKTAGKEIAVKGLPSVGKQVLQKAGKEAAFGATSNALYGAALDATQGKDGKTIAKDALLNAGIGGVLGGAIGGIAGKIASKKMVTLPTVKQKSAIPQSVIDRAEQIKLNKVETQADIPATALNRGQGEVLAKSANNDIKKAETLNLTENKLSDKAATYKTKAEAKTLDDIQNTVSALSLTDKNLLSPIVKKLSNDILSDGTVNKETADTLFAIAYKSGKMDKTPEMARKQFDKSIADLEEKMSKVNEYETKRTTQEAHEKEVLTSMTPERVKQITLDTKPVKAAYNKAVKENNLTDDDMQIVDKLIDGKINITEIPDGYNKSGIFNVYSAKKAYLAKTQPAREYSKVFKKNNAKYGIITDIDKENTSFKNEAILNARTSLANMATDVNKGKIGNGFIGMGKDLDRNLEAAAGNNPALLEALKNNISRPLYAGKANYTKAIQDKTKELAENVVNKYKIAKGSKESAAVQWLGEGQKHVKGELKEYTINDLKKDFPNKWADIVNAEKWFRKEYDTYVQRINTSLEEIYPNPFDDKGEFLSGRRLISRKDYFHHYLEIANTSGLKDVLNNASTDIDPKLIGLTKFTEPKSKFWGALQTRSNNGAYTEDAVGGFLNYLPAAEYKINIEPVLPRLRAVVRDLKEATHDANTKNANKFIGWLMKYTNVLAGKTNPIDRVVVDLGDDAGRKLLNTVDKLSSTMRSSATMGNLNSIPSQLFNLPNVVAYVKNPKYLANGYKEGAAAILGQGEGKNLIAQSPFLQERYLSRSFRQFDEGIATIPKKTMSYALEMLDEAVAKGGWLAAYKQAIDNGMEHSKAIEHADLLIRKSIAGRGIGELPMMQQSKLIKAFIPFTVEVQNTVNMLTELIGKKDALAITGFVVTSYILNEGLKRFNGQQVGLNLIGTTQDTIKNWDNNKSTASNLLTGALNEAGDILSNVPGGQYIGEATDKLLGTTNYGQSIFGEKDPSRFGTGNIVANTFTKPIAQMVNKQNIDLVTPAASLFVPYGGKQLVKTKNSLQDLGVLPRVNLQRKDGLNFGLSAKKQDFAASYSAKNQLRFPIDAKSPLNVAKTLVGGSFATKEGKAYLQSGASPLTDKQTKLIELGNNLGIKPQDYITLRQKVTAAKNSGANAQRQIVNNSSLTTSQKAWFSRNNNLGENVDYTDKDTLKLTTLYSDEVQEKAKTAKGYGINTKDFLTVHDNLQNVHSTNDIFGKPIYLSASRNKKAAIDKVPNLTKQQKEFLYDMYDISEKVR